MNRTVGDLIDRIIRDWLVPPDEQPVRFTLSSDINAGIQTIPYSKALLPIEVERTLSPGVIIEIGQEQIIVGSVNQSQSTISNCIRGANGTTPTAHPTQSVVTLSPPYARMAIYDAVEDAILALHPPLYHLHSTTLTTDTGPVEIPSDYISPQALVVMSGNAPVAGASLIELPNYPASSTGKAVVFENVPSGLDAHFTYRARFHRPTSESNLLFEQLGVEPQWHRLLAVSTVAALIPGKDVAGAYVETLTQRMEAEHFPAPTGTQIQRALLQYHELLLQRAADHLRARDGLPQTYNGRFSS